jgi:hypothetical protein
MLKLAVKAIVIILPTAQIGIAQQQHLVSLTLEGTRNALSLTEEQRSRVKGILERYQIARNTIEERVLGKSLKSIDEIADREHRNRTHVEMERIFREDVATIRQLEDAYNVAAESSYREVSTVLNKEQAAKWTLIVIETAKFNQSVGSCLFYDRIARDWLEITAEQCAAINDARTGLFPRKEGDGKPYARFQAEVMSLLTDAQRQRLEGVPTLNELGVP